MNEAAVLALIDNLIFQNGSRLITGTIANLVLKQMFQYAQSNELDSPFIPVAGTVVAGDSIFKAFEKIQGTLNSLIVGSAAINYTGVLFVDAVYGNDLTGAREDFTKPFLTVDAAVAASSAGDLIILNGGSYTLTVNGFQNSLSYYLSKGTSFDLGSSVANTAGEDYSVFGEGTIYINSSIGTSGTYDGTLNIDVENIYASAASRITSLASGDHKLIIKCKNAIADYGLVSMNGRGELTLDIEYFENAGILKKGLVYFNTLLGLTGSARKHMISCKNAKVSLKEGGVIWCETLQTGETVNCKINGELSLSGSVASTTAVSVINSNVTGDGVINIEGDFKIVNCSYIVNAGTSNRINAKGQINHIDITGVRPAISNSDLCKIVFEGVLISDNVDFSITQNSIFYTYQSVGNCEIELKNADIKNVNSSSTSGVIYKTGVTGILRLKNTVLEAFSAVNKAIDTDSVSEDIIVYSAYTNGLVPSAINNIIGGTTIVNDPAIKITDLLN